MSIRITNNETVALYDSTSGFAFGPTFDSEDDASDFLAWCNETDQNDLRAFRDTTLAGLVEKWKTDRAIDGNVHTAKPLKIV
jgi:hypothetical protein